MEEPTKLRETIEQPYLSKPPPRTAGKDATPAPLYLCKEFNM